MTARALRIILGLSMTLAVGCDHPMGPDMPLGYAERPVVKITGSIDLRVAGPAEVAYVVESWLFAFKKRQPTARLDFTSVAGQDVGRIALTRGQDLVIGGAELPSPAHAPEPMVSIKLAGAGAAGAAPHAIVYLESADAGRRAATAKFLQWVLSAEGQAAAAAAGFAALSEAEVAASTKLLGTLSGGGQPAIAATK